MQADGDSGQTPLPEWARSTPQVSVRLWDREMQLLPGSVYQQVLIPLDYAPSRDLRPRWGGFRPPHAGLNALFRRDEDIARRLIAELPRFNPWFENIEVQFRPESGQPGWIGGAMNAMDLAFVYFFVAKYRPQSYIEIGSGMSTMFAKRAVTDHQLPTRIVSIDPQPRNDIDQICDEVVRDGLETLQSLAIFEQLEPGDIVFLDGSHRSFMNSDVTVFMLDILPKLAPGVLIHLHDIAWPIDYCTGFQHWYWNEQYLLAAWLLAAPEKVQILMPCAYVTGEPQIAGELVPPLALESLTGGWRSGGSFWFTKV